MIGPEYPHCADGVLQGFRTFYQMRGAKATGNLGRYRNPPLAAHHEGSVRGSGFRGQTCKPEGCQFKGEKGLQPAGGRQSRESVQRLDEKFVPVGRVGAGRSEFGDYFPEVLRKEQPPEVGPEEFPSVEGRAFAQRVHVAASAEVVDYFARIVQVVLPDEGALRPDSARARRHPA